MFFRKRKDERHERIEKLCSVISMLDRIRAFRRVNVEEVEEVFREVPYRDIRSEWKKVRHAVEKIIMMPYESMKITRLIKTTYYLRILMMFSMMMALMAMYVKLMYPKLTSPSGALKWIALLSDPKVVLAFIAFFPAVSGLYIFFDYRTRSAIIRYEDEHKEKLKLGRMKIKGLIEKVIAKIISEVRRMRLDLDEFQLELYFRDYRGIQVLKEKHGRIFKRKWPIYVVKFRKKG